ncbi:MAG: protein kinase [Myxococcota bacterium]
MQSALAPFHVRTARVIALAAILGCAFAPRIGAEDARPVAVAPASVVGDLAPIARGFDAWVAESLRRGGLQPRPLTASGMAGVDEAAARGAHHALLTELSEHRGAVELRVVLYAPGTRQILATGVGTATLHQLGSACATALEQVAPALGLSASAITPPLLDELASATRALDLRDAGEPYAAWRAVEGKLAPVAMRAREEIVAAARRNQGDKVERARVLAASGDLLGAWRLVGNDANRSAQSQQPNGHLLLAAAEVQLARDNPKTALRYLDPVLTERAEDPHAWIAMGRARFQQGDREAAREALDRAASLDEQDGLALRWLLKVDADVPGRAASHALRAGQRAAHRLETDRARTHFGRVASLDPNRQGVAAAALGRLEARLGRPAEARAAFQEALDAGHSEAETWSGLGTAAARAGDLAAAEPALRKAIELDTSQPDAVVELAVILVESDRASEAQPLLAKAQELAPTRVPTQLRLARSLRLVGSHSDAAVVLSSGGSIEDVRLLREAARNETARGDSEAARAHLTRAAELKPHDPVLQEELADALEATGHSSGAIEARQLAAVLTRGPSEATEGGESLAEFHDFDSMILSFSSSLSQASRHQVVHLGLREPSDWKTWLRRAVRPKNPDAARLEDGIREAVGARFRLGSVPAEHSETLSRYIDQLYRFEREDALAADVIAAVNGSLDTDGVFVARLFAHPGDHASVECDAGSFAFETRFLRGRSPETVKVLSATHCVGGGLAVYGAWNPWALAALGVLLLGCAFPMFRGWGTIDIRIKLPEKTKGFFSIHVTTRPDQVKQKTIDKRTGREKMKGNRRFDFLRRFERHMAARETTFKWIPARRTPYTVTVSGPLLDAKGEEVIGHFLEEQRVLVKRRGRSDLCFDFRPKECAVEVEILRGGQPAKNARVAIRGDRSSLRYARDGRAYLYLQKGEYTVLLGDKDAAGEFQIYIENLDKAVPLHVDLEECELVFRGCPEAVEPFLTGDLDTASEALARAGDETAAARLRGELLERQGRSEDASIELEAAGRLDHAAELRADSDAEGSAQLFEQAGDHARAGAAYREAGQFEEAARCFEEVYDYGNAIECWREAGNEERELALLERLGEYTDAAELARSMGDIDRAIQNLQQIDQRHPNYGHTCRVIAEIVSERGDHELAVQKFEEALSGVGAENASIDILESYATVLEKAGKTSQALETCEIIRRRDVARGDITERIERLRTRVEARSPSAAGPEASTEPIESRYETLEEIGRGGMGVVYKARDKRLGRIVALKRLPENLREHPNAVELFEREARAAAALNHPNIVTLFDAGEENGNYFLSMELLEGRPLNEIVRKHRRISVRDTARIGMQIAAGLHYAHQQRIVHRDIKTANVFFTNDQVVKIMDFGIAKSLEEVRRSTTIVGGTPYYMAPEQATGAGVDHRADLYAFGVTLYQLATGSLPFSDGDVTYQHAHEAPPDPREIQMDIPADFAALLLQLLEKDPDARPPHAVAVAQSLRACVESMA